VGVEIDGGPVETVKLPLDGRVRKPTLFWKYRLKPGKHAMRLKLLQPSPGAEVKLHDAVIYGDKPPVPTF